MCYYSRLVGRSNGQREVNPFLFPAELPSPFGPLLFWVLLDSHENGTHEIMCGARNDWSAKREMTLNSSKTNMNLIHLCPRELWHTAQPILIYELCTIQYVFVFVNKFSSQVNCEYFSFFPLLCLSSMCYIHTHPPYSSKGKIFCKTH